MGPSESPITWEDPMHKTTGNAIQKFINNCPSFMQKGVACALKSHISPLDLYARVC